MKFQPKTEAELSSNSLLPAGTYPFEVVAAEETVSKIREVNGKTVGGNPMIKLQLRVFGNGDVARAVFDNLVLSEKAQWKLVEFCKAVGLMHRYQSGELNDVDCEGRTGTVKIGTRKGEGFPDQNTVVNYVESMESVTKRAQEDPRYDLDNDAIPF